MKWISVDDKLPKRGGKEYLAWSKDLGHRVLTFRNGVTEKRFVTNYPPTHWMPLPEPPE